MKIYYIPQKTKNICITFVQRRLKVFDADPTLYKWFTNVFFLLGHVLTVTAWYSAAPRGITSTDQGELRV